MDGVEPRAQRDRVYSAAKKPLLPYLHDPIYILVGMEGFEPTEPEAPVLQTGVTLQRHRIPKNWSPLSDLN